MEERPAPLRGMFVAESKHCYAEAVEVMLREIDGCCAEMTVAAVATSCHPVERWAPLAGCAPTYGIDERIAEATRAAQSTVDLFPESMPVSHRSVTCWRDVVRMIGTDTYDLIAVSGLPGRRRDRRALHAAAERSGSRLVHV